MPWLFLPITIAGAAAFSWFASRLKWVTLHGNVLVVSGLRRKIEVPLRDVETVSGSVLMNPELVWLHLRHPTEFGSSIVFMPPIRLLRLRPLRHPLVSELTSLVFQASAGAVEQDVRADERRPV